MRKILFCLTLSSLMSACATNSAFRAVNLDPATFAAICGGDTAGRSSPPVALAASTNSPIAAGSVSCGAARGPASAEYQKVALTFSESDKGLARPNALILVSASPPRDGRLSTELVDAIKIQTSMAGMSRVVMIEKTPLTDQRIYLGYAYP
ncbi:MAG TPA: hypothetical protein VJ698_20630 [Noviherbaspirillum sp.]|uniref:hypothetical protein n=1 Tax=Noviherbaspirillum sp. TaxID=1926288 RepID=UPI002B464DF9|nr:hypothetical protein [Noviherbaspirillum sp.]HJV87889.1 hypothetical protein [Noviherbaspirillum sp.]